MSEKYDTGKVSDESGDEDSTNQALKFRLPPIEIGPNENRLQYGYTLWYSRRSVGKQSDRRYAENLKFIGRFGSVEQFWSLYSHLSRPSELIPSSDFHLFKNGIKPMWEDLANRQGGRWAVTLRKGSVDRCWENLILAMLGEQFMVGEEICGAVVSVRFQEDKVCVWNKTSSDTATTGRIKETLRRVLQLPSDTLMDYKPHNERLKHAIIKSQSDGTVKQTF
ncbi:eukaryotic translation initiation factor 4E type 2 [Microplitis mediator]|uniref:eukaryotic translation initiation factor 4E type 2 n=1 Tax=Microplitis mediator TaxID=375433 RepID=UPI0025520F48|nr:eukaryotic translation initiation factor 4E type 2 [Microplitis mediator]XP_057337798.1 eukaryotic translation initiation factor 4E type 2 [Microplitis mediator]